MKLKGRCYCGEIKYEINGDIQASFQCHCRECQYITGGHPNTAMVIAEENLTFTEGKPSIFSRSDLENPVSRYFCRKCGTGIGTVTPNRPGSFVIKVGTLDTPEIFDPKVAIFTCDKQKFHHIPENLKSFDKRPT